MNEKYYVISGYKVCLVDNYKPSKSFRGSVVVSIITIFGFNAVKQLAIGQDKSTSPHWGPELFNFQLQLQYIKFRFRKSMSFGKGVLAVDFKSRFRIAETSRLGWKKHIVFFSMHWFYLSIYLFFYLKTKLEWQSCLVCQSTDARSTPGFPAHKQYIDFYAKFLFWKSPHKTFTISINYRYEIFSLSE